MPTLSVSELKSIASPLLGSDTKRKYSGSFVFHDDEQKENIDPNTGLLCSQRVTHDREKRVPLRDVTHLYVSSASSSPSSPMVVVVVVGNSINDNRKTCISQKKMNIETNGSRRTITQINNKFVANNFF
jgi:hypothetical protein